MSSSPHLPSSWKGLLFSLVILPGAVMAEPAILLEPGTYALAPRMDAATDEIGLPEDIVFDLEGIEVLPKEDARNEKGHCWYVYLVAYGHLRDSVSRAPVVGATVTGTLIDADDTEFIFYYDFIDHERSSQYSRDRSHGDGYYELWFDACVDDWDWDADFNVCVEKEGYVFDCVDTNYDREDYVDERSFNLARATTPTPTPTATPSPTATPTITANLTKVPETPAPLDEKELIDLLFHFEQDSMPQGMAPMILFERGMTWRQGD
jgi:hypothetical protein